MTIKRILVTAATIALATGPIGGAALASGFATYFAVVSQTGAVATSSGVASAAKVGAGKYEITFNRAISRCAGVVTVSSVAPSYGTTAHKGGAPTVLRVFTYSKAGALTDAAFNMLISCNS